MTVATTDKTPVKVTGGKTLRDYLAHPTIRSSIADVLPKHLTPEKLTKLVCAAVSRQPLLAQCTMPSLLKQLMILSELGLNPSGALGEAYLIPFKRNWKTPDGKWNSEQEVQLVIGYRGFIALARRSGNIQSIESRVVYKDDQFDMSFGLEQFLKHVPNLQGSTEDADIIGAYCIARFKDGGNHVEFMSRKQIDAIRNRSKSSKDGPWVTDYAEMCRKTVIRRGSKYWPLSTEDMLTKAMELEDRIESGSTTVDLVGSISSAEINREASRVADESEPESRTENLAKRIVGTNQHVEVDMSTGEERDLVEAGNATEEQPQDQAASTPTPAADPSSITPDEELAIYMTDVYGISQDQARTCIDAYCKKNLGKSLVEVGKSKLLTKNVRDHITDKKVPVV